MITCSIWPASARIVPVRALSASVNSMSSPIRRRSIFSRFATRSFSDKILGALIWRRLKVSNCLVSAGRPLGGVRDLFDRNRARGAAGGKSSSTICA